MADDSPHIGTLGEKSLHATIKQWYAQPGDKLEQRVGRYVIDIVRDNLLIEIQTRNFAAIRQKLTRLLDTQHTIRLVHPIAQDRWIVRLDRDCQTRLGRRKSPRRGSVYDVFFELARLRDLIDRPNFSLAVILVQDEVIRVNDGQGSWRRKGWSNHDHILLNVIEHVVFDSPPDYLALIPPDLSRPFTNHELAVAIDRPYRIAQSMTRCLRHIGAVDVVGKRGNAHLYAESSSLSG